MPATLRSFRAFAIAMAVLVTLAPHAANATPRGLGTLIEYAGNAGRPVIMR